jgi:nitroimidazol reductase NimA-like FMN-containing flavoprotein (pyridoxamine 5'-phosphate oxidase superfamily)
VELVERWQRGELVTLSEDECRQLLGTQTLGRVAYNDDEGPVVTPVNYAVDGGTLLVATSPESQLARHAPAAAVALEVDQIDADRHSGWSVVVRGHAEVVAYADLPASHTARPAPWTAGDRTLYLRIAASTVTGRRLLPA